MLLGLTGGIGAGKSTALAAFAQLGCPTLSSDAVVHALYLEPEVRAAVVEHFGPGVLGADGEVDRAALGARVFADDADAALARAVAAPARRRGARALARRAGGRASRRAARARGAAAVRGRPRRSLRRRGADHGAGRGAQRAQARALRAARGQRSSRKPRRPRRPTTSTSTTARRPSSSAGWPISSPACARHEALLPRRLRARARGRGALRALRQQGPRAARALGVPAALPRDRARRTRTTTASIRRCWPRSSTASRASARTCAARAARSGSCSCCRARPRASRRARAARRSCLRSRRSRAQRPLRLLVPAPPEAALRRAGRMP